MQLVLAVGTQMTIAFVVNNINMSKDGEPSELKKKKKKKKGVTKNQTEPRLEIYARHPHLLFDIIIKLLNLFLEALYFTVL